MTDSASPMADLDLRLVGYFVAVAEHRHFGRAATALRVAQPSLSRQIRRLEQQIGVRLFDRTPQRTRLTEAGEAFLPRAKALLRSAAQAVAQARDAAQPSRITIGYTTSMIITPAVRALRREHPDADVQTVHLGWNQPRDALLDHRVDAVVCPTALFHRPARRHDPPRRAPGGDRTRRPSPRGQAIGHHRRHRRRTHTETARLRPGLECLLAHRSSARRAQAPDGPLFETLEDGLELVAAGQAVAISTGFHERLRPDITTVPLDGVEPGQIVVATRAGDRSHLVAAFRKLAATHLTAPGRT